MPVLLGAIADDFTGATDLCKTLVRRGMRTAQLIGVPGNAGDVPDAEVLVVALKSRTIRPPRRSPKALRPSLFCAAPGRGRSCSSLEHLEALTGAALRLANPDIPVPLIAIPEGGLQGFADEILDVDHAEFAKTCAIGPHCAPACNKMRSRPDGAPSLRRLRSRSPAAKPRGSLSPIAAWPLPGTERCSA
jgi:Sugar-binding N-terminal domain